MITNESKSYHSQADPGVSHEVRTEPAEKPQMGQKTGPTSWGDYSRQLAERVWQFMRAVGRDLRRGDIGTILAAGLVLAGLLAAVLGHTSNAAVNFLLLASPVALGWTLRIGVERQRRGEDKRVTALALCALFLFGLGWCSMASRTSNRFRAGQSGPGPAFAQDSPGRSQPQRRTGQRVSARGSIDPALVGSWRRTNSTITRVGSAGSLNLASDTYCRLNADGTFAYGGGQTSYSSQSRVGGGSGSTSAGQVVRGHWKVSGNVLYSKTANSQWVALGRYSVSGNAMVLYPNGGGRQLWER